MLETLMKVKDLLARDPVEVPDYELTCLRLEIDAVITIAEGERSATAPSATRNLTVQLTVSQVATIAGAAHQHMLEYMRDQEYIPRDAHPDIIDRMHGAIQAALTDLGIAIHDPMELMAEHCPNCDANLTGSPIPKKDRHHYTRGATHFSRKIGVYDRVSDRTVEWACPDCGHHWPLVKDLLPIDEQGPASRSLRTPVSPLKQEKART